MRGAPPILRFGVFELNLATEELRKFGTLIKLAPQPFELLALLATQAGQIVTREQIQFQLWGDDTFVDFEQGMNHCVRQIRNALSDNAEMPRYIETVPRRGYRFVAPVEVVKATPNQSLLTIPEEAPSKGIATASSHDSGPVDVAVSGVAVSTATEKIAVAPELSSATRPRSKWLIGGLLALLIVIAAIGAYRIFLASSRQRASDDPDIRHRKTVAVLGFKNIGGHPDTGIPLSTALTTMLTTDLAVGDQLRIVPSAEVDGMKREMGIGDADSLQPEILKRIRKRLGADYVVTGTYIAEGAQVRVDLRVQDTATGDNIASLAANGNDGVSGLAQLASDANANIRPKLGVPAVSQEEISGIRATLPDEPAAAHYYQGLEKLRAFDALSARGLLEKAVAAEPDFAPAHLALAEALKTLGYSKLAREEAEKAYANSANLPAQERLLIEARDRELTNKWDQAIALYSRIWEPARNNVDFGLRLAGAQTKAGKAKDALDTLQALRGLPRPERDDLRIDLEEANAWYALGEYDREQAAADSAARKAEALGGFALARARKAQGKALFYRGHFDEAIATYRQSLAISQVLGDRGEIASSSNNIAGVLQEQGNLAAALELHANALAAFRAIGNRESAAATMSNMGSVYQLQGELGEAMNMYNQALDIYRELGERINEGIVLYNIAEVLFLNGDLRLARQRHVEALAIDRQIGNQSNEAEALVGLGKVLAAEGDLNAAKSLLQKALEIRTQRKEVNSVLESQLALAAIALDQGNAAEAEQVARTAAEGFRSMKLADKEVEALTLLARALLAQGKQVEAAQVMTQAQAAASALQDRFVLLDLDLASAQVLSRSDDAGKRLEATQKLENLTSEAARRQYLQLQLQATLALAENELYSGSASAGLARLASLRKQASSRGFGLVARQAAAAERRSKAA